MHPPFSSKTTDAFVTNRGDSQLELRRHASPAPLLPRRRAQVQAVDHPCQHPRRHGCLLPPHRPQRLPRALQVHSRTLAGPCRPQSASELGAVYQRLEELSGRKVSRQNPYPPTPPFFLLSLPSPRSRACGLLSFSSMDFSR